MRDLEDNITLLSTKRFMMPVNFISYIQSQFKRKSLVVFKITLLSTDSNSDGQDSITERQLLNKLFADQ